MLPRKLNSLLTLLIALVLALVLGPSAPAQNVDTASGNLDKAPDKADEVAEAPDAAPGGADKGPGKTDEVENDNNAQPPGQRDDNPGNGRGRPPDVDRGPHRGPVVLLEEQIEKLKPEQRPVEMIDVARERLTHVAQIKSDPQAHEDQEIVIQGEYMGWSPDPKRTVGLPMTRMDWAIKDENGDCIYVVALDRGLLPLHPYRDVGRPVVVRARVRLTPETKAQRAFPGPKPYLEPLVIQVGKSKKPEAGAGNADKADKAGKE